MSENFVTCQCQHCDGGIEFDASDFAKDETRAVECPHCKTDTTIFVPEHRAPPAISNNDSNLLPRKDVDLGEGVPNARQAAIANFMAEQGNYHLESENYEEAIKCFKAAARGENSIAQYHLGVCYSNGFGVAKDDSEAARWFRLAAEQGDSDAQNNLGIAYDNGSGVPCDINEAIKWWRKSGEQGNQCALLNLGCLYWRGGKVPKDYPEAVKWFSLAANEGSADAQVMLGRFYAKGEGVPRDRVEGMKWYRMAAEQGNLQAQNIIGLAYCYGDGVPQNFVEAYKWANLAAAAGSDDAKKLRDDLTQKMTPSQVEDGQRLAAREASKIRNPPNQTEQERQARVAIPSEVRREVWRRDGGVCVKCGSRRNLEYDHIVPVSKGGSNTARNIELLCETCNRTKSNSIR
ncbi:MAG: HNH endonuclease [Formivibrio sp.]|nr:HNH endonuclease [Formivibrio sp.]